MRTIRENMKHLLRTQRHGRPAARQRGAALVVGLLMLMVITLLAIAGMNSASVEFVMAGNSQYHQYAFQAAESGIQQTLANQPFVPFQADIPLGPATLSGTAANDGYSGRLIYASSETLTWNNSVGPFAGFDYQITSIGTSARNSTSTHIQGIFQLARNGQSQGSGKGGGAFAGSGGTGGGVVAVSGDALTGP